MVVTWTCNERREVPPATVGPGTVEISEKAGTPGRPRHPEPDQAIPRATVDIVVRRGLVGATVEAIACRAGTGKGAVYRRWPSKTSLVIAATRAQVRQVTIPDTGSLREDLHACALRKPATSCPCVGLAVFKLQMSRGSGSGWGRPESLTARSEGRPRMHTTVLRRPLTSEVVVLAAGSLHRPFPDAYQGRLNSVRNYSPLDRILNATMVSIGSMGVTVMGAAVTIVIFTQPDARMSVKSGERVEKAHERHECRNRHRVDTRV
ncbi:TetR/AcrR family transcriptional regulator [Streptomyces sp. NPDC056672]|uniref:TetR/AcrR family transcriptional regulator n=1 Tax=Streptomyces sp. NPDC056672 TaxID=3345906 RepID=UPI0036BA697A